MNQAINPKPSILLTGATGYIGGRLLKILEQDEIHLRCLAREPTHLQGRCDPRTEVVKGNIDDLDSLLTAMQGIEVAYYLVHSMASSADFTAQDRRGAINFARAAAKTGVKRIIYLGGLGDSQQDLSTHLRSRQEVGECLRRYAGTAQVIEFRTSIVIGSGSVSFEMIRALCERLPLMLTPKWVWTKAQPIAIGDLLHYLEKAIDVHVDGHTIFEIGGKDQTSYGGIMQEYCYQRGLNRKFIHVPVLTPYLSSLWLGLVTPLYARIGRQLIESAFFATVVLDSPKKEYFKSAADFFTIQPINMKDAIASSLANEDQEFGNTHWSDATSSSGLSTHWAGERFGNRIADTRSIEVAVTPEEAFMPIRRLGGNTGWYYGNALWHLRGYLDLLFGGVGLKRGRRHPENLRVGDVIDWWRVEAIEENHLLRLKAEMRLPGRAWLEFIVVPTAHGTSIQQTAIFDPLGVGGLLYWYVLYPIHQFIFAGMLRGIGRQAQQVARKRQAQIRKTE